MDNGSEYARAGAEHAHTTPSAPVQCQPSVAERIHAIVVMDVNIRSDGLAVASQYAPELFIRLGTCDASDFQGSIVLLGLLPVLVFALASSVPDAIGRNSQSIGGIRSYHLKIVAETTPEPGGELVPSAEWEVWHDRETRTHRRLDRVFNSVGPDGILEPVDEPHGRILQSSSDFVQVRTLSGWDPDRPYALPLEFGRNAKEWSSVSGGIGVRDPTARVNDVEASTLFWELAPGWSLAELIAICEINEVPSSSPTATRLRIDSVNDPALAHLAGTLVDLDHEHGWLVRRIERQWVDVGTAISEVLRFASTSDGHWIPVDTVGTLNGEIISRAQVVEFEINSALTPELLQIQFPEGARVNDANGQIHLWGKGQPEKSFTNFEDFMNHIYARAREYQGANAAVPAAVPERGSERLWLLLANAIIIGGIVLLTIWRRRLSRGA